MKVLVINAGSSSLKFTLFDMANGAEQVIASGLVERVGTDKPNLIYKRPDGSKFEESPKVQNHGDALKAVCAKLCDPEIGVLKNLSEVTAIGHRVLHGGEKITMPVKVDQGVKDIIRECFPLGPLHNPANLMGIEACEEIFAGVPNVAVFDTDVQMPAEKFAYALNVRLPEDIKVLQSEEVSDNFHPRFHNSHKTYVYQILNTRIPIPTLTRYMHHLYEDIDINRMKAAEDIFIGEHDFSAFCSAGAQVKSKVRTIESLKVIAEPLYGLDHSDGQTLTKSPFGGKIIRIEVTGTGFLYKMVRSMVGALMFVGRGRMTPDQFRGILLACDRAECKDTAPARGLFLKRVFYEPETWLDDLPDRPPFWIA